MSLPLFLQVQAGTVLKTDSDSFTLSEPAAQIGLSDSDSISENTIANTVSTTISDTDTASLSVEGSLVGLADTDTESLSAETGAESSSVVDTDSGALTEPSNQTNLTDSDAASLSSETGAVVAGEFPTGSDTASLSGESGVLSVITSASDTGTLGEATSQSVVFGDTDTGSLSEATQPLIILISDTDSMVLVGEVSGIGVSDTDAGLLTESFPSIANVLSGSEVFTLSELGVVTRPAEGAEFSTHTRSFRFTVGSE